MYAVLDDDHIGALLARAARGDEVAFERIVAEHQDTMARVAFVVTGDVEIARDAVQASWPKVWRKLQTIRDPERLRPWLAAVVANEAKQLARSRWKRRVREVSMSAPDQPMAQHAKGADPAARTAELDLAAAVASLNPDDRVLVGLRYAAGLTSDEIGAVIGMTGGGVRARIARILARLRNELADG
jgi:RNA polymerase sigma-70 factor, ECF subfamily